MQVQQLELAQYDTVLVKQPLMYDKNRCKSIKLNL